MHWLNFAFLAGMVWSGLLIYWANDVYDIRIADHDVFHFFPDGFYTLLGIDYHLAEGLAIHFTFMWLFAANGFAYVVYTLAAGEWRRLTPGRHALRDAGAVVLHDLHLRPGLPKQGTYNAAQRIAYTLVIVMGAGSLLTGLAIYKPVQLGWLTGLLGGYEAARWEHFALTMGFVGFFAIHVLQVVRAGWPNFKSMIAGYELHQDQGETEP